MKFISQIQQVEKCAQECGEFAHTRNWPIGFFTDAVHSYGTETRLPDCVVLLSTKSEFTISCFLVMLSLSREDDLYSILTCWSEEEFLSFEEYWYSNRQRRCGDGVCEDAHSDSCCCGHRLRPAIDLLPRRWQRWHASLLQPLLWLYCKSNPNSKKTKKGWFATITRRIK